MISEEVGICIWSHQAIVDIFTAFSQKMRRIKPAKSSSYQGAATRMIDGVTARE